MKKERLLTIAEAAKAWNVGEQRARDIIRDEQVAIERVGRTKRFLRIRNSEVQRIKTARQIPEFVEA